MKSSATENDLQFVRRLVLWAKQKNRGAAYQPKVLQGHSYFGESSFTVTNAHGQFSLSTKTPSTHDTL